MNLALASASRWRGTGTVPPDEPPPEAGWTYATLAPLGPSGLRPPIPPGWQPWWMDSFDYSSVAQLLAATFNGSPIWTTYSGPDAAYGSGFWAPSHVTVAGSQLVLNGYFDPAVSGAAGKYVTGGIATSPMASNGNVPAGAMWLWCTREEPAGAAPVKVAGMTYGTQYPWKGQFARYGDAVGSQYAEWPYCGEIDAREGVQGALSLDANLHWHDPAAVNSSNPAGHVQVKAGTLAVDTTKWVIHGHYTDADGTYRGLTNDAATVDQPLRTWVTKTGVDTAFQRAGRRWILQQEAFAQPDAGTPQTRVFVDWVMCLVPQGKSMSSPPATIIDLVHWKETLPVDPAFDTVGIPLEWTHLKVESAAHGSFFHPTLDGKAVIFRANVGGARTGASSFARSEERGLNLDGSPESFGGNDGATHTLIVTQTIDHLPEHRPEVVSVQIHGKDSASFLLIEPSGYYPSTPGSTTFVKGAETAPFKVLLKVNRLDGTGQVYAIPVLSGLHLGDTFSTKLVMGSGVVLVYMDLGDKGPTGATTLVHTVTEEVPPEGAYFKVGCYVQSNPTNVADGRTVPHGTAATGGDLTAPIAAGLPTGDAALSEYGQVTVWYQHSSHVADVGEGPPPAGKVPAQVLDLTKQKITLPITLPAGELGNEKKAGEVTRPTLDTYSHPAYYYVQQFGGIDEVVCVAPANGATTSGSGNPRMEHREMAGAAGTTPASWSTMSGTHRLYWVGRILQLPINKPQVVFCQIHDASPDFEFLADGFSPVDSGTPVTGTGTGAFCIGHRNWAGAQQYDTPLLQVHIGQLFTFEVVVSGGNIDMFADLGDVASGSVTHRKTFAAGSHTACYGKGGCYTQANSTNADGGVKHVPSSHYPGLPALTSAGAVIAGEPPGSAGATALRKFLITHS